MDKTFADAGVGHSHSTDTRGALFLGGHAFMKKMRGYQTRTYFSGCIRKVVVNNSPINILPKMANAGVQVGVCPTV